MRDEPPPVRVIRVYDSGDWSYERRSPDIPILGVFLLVLGVILLLDQVAPGAMDLGIGAVGVAVGVAFLVNWFRGGWGLYPGILFTAVSLPGLLEALGAIPVRDGYGTFLLGVGLLLVAAARLRDERGLGWQGFLGVIFTLFGGVAASGYPNAGNLVWAALLIAIGVWVLVRR